MLDASACASDIEYTCPRSEARYLCRGWPKEASHTRAGAAGFTLQAGRWYAAGRQLGGSKSRSVVPGRFGRQAPGTIGPRRPVLGHKVFQVNTRHSARTEPVVTKLKVKDGIRGVATDPPPPGPGSLRCRGAPWERRQEGTSRSAGALARPFGIFWRPDAGDEVNDRHGVAGGCEEPLRAQEVPRS